MNFWACFSLLALAYIISGALGIVALSALDNEDRELRNWMAARPPFLALFFPVIWPVLALWYLIENRP